MTKYNVYHIADADTKPTLWAEAVHLSTVVDMVMLDEDEILWAIEEEGSCAVDAMIGGEFTVAEA